MGKYLSKLGFILFVFILMGCSHEEKMKLKKDRVIVEYGQSVSMSINDYLDNQDEFLKDVDMSIDGQNEKNHSYLAIGQYKVTFKHNQETCSMILEVKDTIAPEFQDLKESYQVGFKGKFDINQLKVKDLSKVTLLMDDSQVNYSQSGTYTATVSAKDESGNETKKQIRIIVKKENKKKSNTNKSTSSSKSKESSSQDKSDSKGTVSKKNNSKSGDTKNNSSIVVTPDKDSHYEFNNGNNWADGASGLEIPPEWGY